MKARYEIMLENYIKTINIEALTMIDMVNKDILPAISKYISELSETVKIRSEVMPNAVGFEKGRIEKLSALSLSIADKVETLEQLLADKPEGDSLTEAKFVREKIFEQMTLLRADVDSAESITASSVWPYPSYGELLFGVR